MARLVYEVRQFDRGIATVTITGSPTQAGTKAVSFQTPFTAVPDVMVVAAGPGITGTFAVEDVSPTTLTKTGFVVSVSGLNLGEQDIGVFWWAAEKGIIS